MGGRNLKKLEIANAKQAAIRAGYSAKTAEQQGSRLLGNVEVLEAVRVAKEAQAARLLSNVMVAKVVLASSDHLIRVASIPVAVDLPAEHGGITLRDQVSARRVRCVFGWCAQRSLPLNQRAATVIFVP
ncbi:terminase small subunit [Rhodanobacter sp. DHB23]|nr:terminase small subunit [Rhodanobacter sp. DHB23]